MKSYEELLAERDALINQENKLCTGQIKGLDVDNPIVSQKFYFDTKTSPKIGGLVQSNDFVLLPKNLTATLLAELTNGDSSKNSIMKLRYAQLISAAERDGFILPSVMQDGWNSFSHEPQQCLAEIKAESILQAIKFFAPSLDIDVEALEAYAEKIRKGEL